jgi:Uma2 family endonuclease
MSIDHQVVTIMEFEAFVNLPDHHAGRFELINGEIVAVPSNPFVSIIAMRIAFLIQLFLHQTQLGGYVSGEGGGFVVDGNIFAPDVAYLDKLPVKKGFEPTPPLLAVEVLSEPNNSQEQAELRRKIIHYMRAGVVLWVVDYVNQTIQVMMPDSPVQTLGIHDILQPETVLQGFSLPLTEIFQFEDER